MSCSIVEPEVFEPPAVVDAVDHRREPLDVGLSAGRGAAVKNDRSGAVLGQPPLDLLYQLLALLLVEFDRLAVDQIVDLGIAIAIGVILGSAGVSLIESLVRVVDGVERGAE